jgi:large repetitive protein
MTMHAAVRRISPRRSLVLLVVIAVAVAAAMVVLTRQADAAITTAFARRFETNTNGAIILRGNANLVCPTSDPDCATGQNGTNATATRLDNNYYLMQDNDTDSDPATFNESSANISLPAGSTVLWAGLYWSADTSQGSNSTGAVARSAVDKDKVIFRTPAAPSTTSTVTADQVFVTNTSIYQGFKDVTTTVAGAGNGVYTVANIQAGTGKDRYAGWSLVIAYHNAAERLHNLHVWDGFGVVKSGTASDSTVDIPVSGFQAPSSGTVHTTVGTVVYEGDRGKTGDALQISGDGGSTFTTMSDSLHPADNYFDSRVSEDNANVTSRSPANDNLMGVDVDRFDATGTIPHNSTSATLRLTTSNETFYPGVVTFTTDMFAPDVVTTPTGVDLNGGTLVPGDILEYTIDVENKGDDTADNVVITDAIPTHTTYVPGSATAGGTLSGGVVSWNLGSMAPAATRQVKFQVRVDNDTPANYAVVNASNSSFDAHSSAGVSATGPAATTTNTVLQPTADLGVALTGSTAIVQRATSPNTVNYTATVTNNGSDMEPAPQVVYTLPTGVTAVVASLPSNCAISGNTVTCTLTAINANSTGSVVLPVSVDATAAAHPVVSVQASGSGSDTAQGNNTDTTTLAVNTAPVANDDTSPVTTTPTNTPVSIDVRANDTDADGAVSALTPQIVQQPTNGTAAVQADGTVLYTPANGWTGADSFTYRVQDGQQGWSSPATVSVFTSNAAPVANPDNYATTNNTPKTVSPMANDTDANNQARHMVSVGQPQAGAGSTVLNPDGTVTYDPGLSFRGTATFTYVVADTQNAQSTGTVTVTVANAAPVAVNDTDSVAYRGTVDVDVLHNDTDNNGDALTITGVGAAAHGGTVTPQNGKITYTAPTGFSGNDTFTYTISDGHSGTATATVTVTVGNAVPVATAHSVSTGTNTAAQIPVLTYASDANSTDTLTVAGLGTPTQGGTVVLNPNGTVTYTPPTGYAGPDSFTYTVSDGHPGGTATNTISVTVDNAPPTAGADSFTVPGGVATTVAPLTNDHDANTADHLTITIDTPPTHGTATVNPDGTVTYTPTPGYLGPDSFHYTVSDGHPGGTAGATASFSVVNLAPTANPDATSTDTDTAVTVTVLANDTDPNGDALHVTATTPPSHGQITLNANNTITYTPAAGFFGTDTFTYTASDPSGLDSTAVVTITVRDAAPIAVDDHFVARPGVDETLPVLGNDTDPNTGQAISVTSVGTASHGTVTLNPDGTVTYRTNATSGTDSFTYVLTDDEGLTDTATVTITIDAAPTAAADVVPTASNTAVTIPVLANDTDPESQTLTLVSVTNPGHGTAVVIGNQVRYTPANGFYGADTFSYTVRDTAGNLVTGQVTVNVAPPAADTSTAVLAGHSVDVTVTSDPHLTLSAVGTPQHGTATIVNGKVRYTPATGFVGTDTFTYTVRDPNGGTSTATVTVTVSDGKPVAVADKRTTPYQKAVTIKVLDNDLDPNGGLTVTTVGTADHGTVTFTGTEVVFTPAAGFSGDATFTYTATDVDGNTTTADVTVTVGTAPAVPDKSVTAKPGSPVRIKLPTTDKNGKPVTIKSVGEAEHGTVKLNSDGTVTYTPEKGFAGIDSFTYEVVDEDGNVAMASIEVKVAGANKAPVAKNDKVSVVAGGSIVIKPMTNDSDPDGDKTSITKISKPRHGTAVLNANGTVTYAPKDGYAGGTDSFTYTLSDGHGGTTTATVTITITAAASGGGSGGGSGSLPVTGPNVISLAVTGILVLLLGGAMVAFGQNGVPVPVLLIGRGPGRHRPGRHRPLS